MKHLNRFDEALAVYNSLLEAEPEKPEFLYPRGCLFSVWNKPDEAIEDLRRAIALDPEKRDAARTDPDFENIRDDPRFRELVGEEEPPPEESADS